MTDISSTGGPGRQFRLAALLLVPVLAILLAFYLAFLREDFALLAQDLRPEEANAIVTELKKEDVGYRIEQGGTAILVPRSRADELKLAILGRGIADPGSVGFELFNESDMGLTDFAQKVNYQRALQGELARTIMGMEGITYARVHLALPERSLFRTNRSEPRAAVTIVPKAGVTLDDARIAGIQRLVASTIIDLQVHRVAVLNQRGQLLTADPEVGRHGRMEHASPLERAYAGRIGQAINGFAPELGFDLEVTTVARPAVASGTAQTSAGERDHAIRVVVFTPASITPELRGDLARLIGEVMGARPEWGDDIQFSIEPQVPTPVHGAAPVAESIANSTGKGVPVPAFEAGYWAELAALATAATGAAVLFLFARRRRKQQREQLYIRIREQLRIEAA